MNLTESILWLYAWFGVALAVIGLLLVIRLLRAGEALRRLKARHCPNCHTQGSLRYRAQGSPWIELALWSGFLLPGLFYSLWRHSRRLIVCRHCRRMIPPLP